MQQLIFLLVLVLYPKEINVSDPPGLLLTSLETPIVTTESNPAELPKTRFSDIEAIPDLYFEYHIAELANKTSIPLFYDETVRYYINLYFTERKNQIPTINERSVKYFPIFQKHLEKNNLPQELKYLPILESALSAKAVSPSSAVGLWQFKKETGIHCGLRIDHQIDERTDPEASTIAACKYLKEMYKQFGDWHMALMAYQAGPGTIRRAIETSGGKTGYHELYEYLPAQTQKYLPAYVAMIYIFTFYENH